MYEQLSFPDSNLNVTRYPYEEYIGVLTEALTDQFGDTPGVTIHHHHEEVHSMRPGVRLISRTDMTKRHQELPHIPYDKVANAIQQHVAPSLRSARMIEVESVGARITDRNIGYIIIKATEQDKATLEAERDHVVSIIQQHTGMPRLHWRHAPMDLTIVQTSPETSHEDIQHIIRYLGSLLPQKIPLQAIKVEASPSWSWLRAHNIPKD